VGGDGERDVTGILAALVGAAGGNGDLVQLEGATELTLELSPATAGAGYRLTSGGLEQSGVGSANLVSYSTIADWVTPTSNANLYEVRATLTSGSLSSGTTGSWLALTSTRTWEVAQTGLGSQSATLDVEVRLASSGVVKATGLVSLTAEVVI